MKLEPVYESHVGFRLPHFLKCSKCGQEISGTNRQGLAKYAKEKDWVYDYKNDRIYCGVCAKKMEVYEEKENCFKCKYAEFDEEMFRVAESKKKWLCDDLYMYYHSFLKPPKWCPGFEPDEEEKE